MDYTRRRRQEQDTRRGRGAVHQDVPLLPPADGAVARHLARSRDLLVLVPPAAQSAGGRRAMRMDATMGRTPPSQPGD